VDEKSQIQALDRSRAVFPMRPGQRERRSHESTRHGTSLLFAVLATVIGQGHPCHRALMNLQRFIDVKWWTSVSGY
jgi:hypothetical protein